MLKWLRMWLMMVVVLLAACKPVEEQPLPTVLDLGGTSTQAAVNATQNAPTLTPTRSVATLPPTFTPTPIPSATPTDVAEVPTTTPEGFHASGTIYYIFNGDSVAALAGDGSAEELVLAGGKYADLTMSPDGQFLTYVAAGSGSPREVFISSRDGTYTQAISCLGFANVLQPTWRPDGQAIAFIASPIVGGALDIYIANIAGANTCPHGNDQRQFIKLGSPRVRDLAWNPAGDKFFFSDLYIFGLDIARDKLYPLTPASGFGPDFALMHNPITSKLAYLQTTKDTQTGEFGGNLFQIDTSSITEPPFAEGGTAFFAQSLQWSKDGRLLLVGTNTSIQVFDAEYGNSVEAMTGLISAPQPVFDPTAKTIAYIANDPANPAIQQIYTVSRTGGVSRQLTKHQEGTISDLNWVEG